MGEITPTKLFVTQRLILEPIKVIAAVINTTIA
jgi:hypothetical protein